MSVGRMRWPTIASRLLTTAVALAVALTIAASLAIGQAHAETTASAATNGATTPSTVSPSSPFASMVQGLVGLVIVVALIYGVAWIIKRVGPRARTSGIVQVLGGASVGPREKVVVVRFGGETLLLGVAPGQVSLLHTAVDGAGFAEGTAPDAQPRFVDRLRAARSGA